jgi:hypothetical protein
MNENSLVSTYSPAQSIRQLDKMYAIHHSMERVDCIGQEKGWTEFSTEVFFLAMLAVKLILESFEIFTKLPSHLTCIIHKLDYGVALNEQ